MYIYTHTLVLLMFIIIIIKARLERSGLIDKRTCYSGRGPRFSSKSLRKSLTTIAVPLDPIPASGLFGHQTCS